MKRTCFSSSVIPVPIASTTKGKWVAAVIALSMMVNLYVPGFGVTFELRGCEIVFEVMANHSVFFMQFYPISDLSKKIVNEVFNTSEQSPKERAGNKSQKKGTIPGACHAATFFERGTGVLRYQGDLPQQYAQADAETRGAFVPLMTMRLGDGLPLSVLIYFLLGILLFSLARRGIGDGIPAALIVRIIRPTYGNKLGFLIAKNNSRRSGGLS